MTGLVTPGKGRQPGTRGTLKGFGVVAALLWDLALDCELANVPASPFLQVSIRGFDSAQPPVNFNFVAF
jgi:hypothetical protein